MSRQDLGQTEDGGNAYAAASWPLNRLTLLKGPSVHEFLCGMQTASIGLMTWHLSIQRRSAQQRLHLYPLPTPILLLLANFFVPLCYDYQVCGDPTCLRSWNSSLNSSLRTFARQKSGAVLSLRSIRTLTATYSQLTLLRMLQTRSKSSARSETNCGASLSRLKIYAISISTI